MNNLPIVLALLIFLRTRVGPLLWLFCLSVPGDLCLSPACPVYVLGLGGRDPVPSSSVRPAREALEPAAPCPPAPATHPVT